MSCSLLRDWLVILPGVVIAVAVVVKMHICDGEFISFQVVLVLLSGSDVTVAASKLDESKHSTHTGGLVEKNMTVLHLSKLREVIAKFFSPDCPGNIADKKPWYTACHD